MLQINTPGAFVRIRPENLNAAVVRIITGQIPRSDTVLTSHPSSRVVRRPKSFDVALGSSWVNGWNLHTQHCEPSTRSWNHSMQASPTRQSQEGFAAQLLLFPIRSRKTEPNKNVVGNREVPKHSGL